MADGLGIKTIPYPTVVAAATSLLWKVVVGADYQAKCSMVYSNEIWKRFPAFRKWIGHVGASNKSPVSQTQLLASIVYVEDIAKRPDLAERFFAGVITGKDLSAGDPILALRNRMFAYRSGKGSMILGVTWPATVQAINALEEDRPLQKVNLFYESFGERRTVKTAGGAP